MTRLHSIFTIHIQNRLRVVLDETDSATALMGSLLRIRTFSDCPKHIVDWNHDAVTGRTKDSVRSGERRCEGEFNVVARVARGSRKPACYCRN
jgi:hypothetical protein